MRGQPVQDWHRESNRVFLLGVRYHEHERLVVEHFLPVDVLDEDMKELRAVVHLRVKLKVGRDRKLDSQQRARDGLHVRREF